MPTPVPDATATPRCFTTTHWSVVLAARATDTAGSEALNQLCRAYWPPIYAFIRRQGHGAAEAQDATQEFFARLVHRDYLARVGQQQGKFRSFLLALLTNFLSEQRGRAKAQKRGGGHEVLSLDAFEGPESYLTERVDELTPEQIFERRWAQTVLQRALDRLAAEYLKSGKLPLFEELKDFQPRQPGALTYAQIAARLGISEGAVKSAMQRMRQRHRDILRDEIAQTVASATEVDEEIRHLRKVLDF